MTLPTSGAIHLAQIGQEAKKPLLSKADLNDVEMRKLPNILGKTVPGSQISFADFYGATYGVGIGYSATDFVDLTGQLPNSTITSNMVYITELGSPASFAINSTQPAWYQINSGAWNDKSVLGSLSPGDTLSLRVTTAEEGTTALVTAQFGGHTRDWQVGVKSLITVQIPINIYQSIQQAGTSTSINLITQIGVGGTVVTGSQSAPIALAATTRPLAETYGYSYTHTFDGYLTVECWDDENPVIPTKYYAQQSGTGSTNPAVMGANLSNALDFAISLKIRGVTYTRLTLTATVYAVYGTYRARTSYLISVS